MRSTAECQRRNASQNQLFHDFLPKKARPKSAPENAVKLPVRADQANPGRELPFRPETRARAAQRNLLPLTITISSWGIGAFRVPTIRFRANRHCRTKSEGIEPEVLSPWSSSPQRWARNHPTAAPKDGRKHPSCRAVRGGCPFRQSGPPRAPPDGPVGRWSTAGVQWR